VKHFITIFFFSISINLISSQEDNQIFYKVEGDSVYSSHINLEEVTVYKPIKLETHEDLVMYYTLKRKTLKVYPYAKMASERLTKLNSRLLKIKSNRKKKKYTKLLEKFIQDELTEELKKLTKTEGQILVKLIHRETGITAYDLVKELRNGFRAFSYSIIAKFFDISLKKEFNPENNKEDLFIEDILTKDGV
jgi:Mor family transcriptional regulator